MAGEMAVQVGRRIRELREAKGWNQRQLADALEIAAVTNQTISVYERGVNRPSDERLEQIARVLGATVSDFYANPKDGDTPDPFTSGTVDLSVPHDQPQLDRIEAALAEILSRLPAPATESAEEDASDLPPPEQLDSDEGEDEHATG